MKGGTSKKKKWTKIESKEKKIIRHLPPFPPLQKNNKKIKNRRFCNFPHEHAVHLLNSNPKCDINISYSEVV
jgi:hypothetical protein